MKTVSGELVFTQPISLPRAANYLSKFVNSDNGASQSVSAYVRRASSALNDLAYVNKHHNQKNRLLKEAGSINSGKNPKTFDAIDARVSESSYDNRKFDGSQIEGKPIKKRRRTKADD